MKLNYNINIKFNYNILIMIFKCNILLVNKYYNSISAQLFNKVAVIWNNIIVLGYIKKCFSQRVCFKMNKTDTALIIILNILFSLLILFELNSEKGVVS